MGTRRHCRPGSSAGSLRNRLVLGRLVLVLALVAAGLKLLHVQGLQAAELSAQAADQRTTVQTLPAERGRITDRNGTPLAFSVAAQALYAQPQRIVAEQQAVRADPDLHKQAMARRVAEVLGPPVSEQEILSQLRSDRTTVLLAPFVRPAQARAIQQDFPEISAEHREIRQYPGGELAANARRYPVRGWSSRWIPTCSSLCNRCSATSRADTGPKGPARWCSTPAPPRSTQWPAMSPSTRTTSRRRLQSCWPTRRCQRPSSRAR